MVVDCFTFFNELDLLEIRLEELDDVVDYFVLVEAGKTQSLLDKPFYFEENKDRYAKFLDKIVHVKVEDYPDNRTDLWQMENHQRNCILRGLAQLSLDDSDIIMISDLDEIPRKSTINSIKERYLIDEIGAMSFVQDFYAYFLNLKCINQHWVGTVAASYSIVQSEKPQGLRRMKDFLARIPDAGWHFSWLGGAEAVWKKANSCIEPFDKENLPSVEEYKSFFDNYKNMEQRGFVRTEDLSIVTHQKFDTVSIDESFPAEIVNNLPKYAGNILHEKD